MTKKDSSPPPRTSRPAPSTLSAGVVVVRQIADKRNYLLLRAYRYWDAPRGGGERGEEPGHAPCREVEEETTLRDLDFRWLDYDAARELLVPRVQAILDWADEITKRNRR